MELYTVVFEFFTEIFTQWSKSPWKRFIKSFDEQAFHNLFTEKRSRMKAIEHRMERYAHGVHMQSDMTFQRDTRRWQSDVDQTLTQIMRRLNNNVQNGLESRIQHALHNTSIGLLGTSSQCPFNEQVGSGMASTNLEPVKAESDNKVAYTEKPPDESSCSTNDALSLLEPIAARYNSNIQELVGLTSRALKVAVEIQVKRRLETWTSSLDSNRIWMQGPHDASHPSQNTLTAACLVGLANHNKIPFISYFGSLQQERDMYGRYLSPPEILLDMVKSLIVQLLLIQDDPSTIVEVLTRDFEKLLGSAVDLDVPLDILRRLRALVPPYLLCVIESVQILEDRSNTSHTESLHKVLREVINLGQPQHHTQPQASEGTGGEEKVVKVCFTSDGHADVLAVAAQRGSLEKIAYDAEGDAGGEGEQLGSLWDDGEGSDD
ncbi:uncharacterized protein PG986_002552 [Apiospora aurea]|uniref:Uncharacterized protein n=1 Tax=Apiospora aurea TaxID=335848 RepID=A0ABR1QP61_9PEZI